ncbi:MAG: DegT/DnrJ/EryC1/StrS family aminotransferase [Verrucomicrobiales bacterium]|nr:DegT/DnrJ/EryC1/StrS family aminotransferase [Verrucomicrobiales bacterium]
MQPNALIPKSVPQAQAVLPVREGAFSRRAFLARGAALLPVAGTAPAARRTVAAESPGDPIDPGYVGPQFFDEQERRALADVLEAGSPFRYWGPGRPDKVRRFEDAFARTMGTRFALGVTSGTAALDCAVAALGIGPGDEVILPAYTWWSDYTCVVHAGALPVFAEIDDTLNLDPYYFAQKITPRTKAVIVVHLLGGPADLGPILGAARQQGVRVIEDCAQCVGGSFRGAPLGSLGDLGIYSFQINKMITSGEGGAVVTNDPVLYERAVRFHDMGNLNGLFQERLGGSQETHFAGENFRMNELTGAVLGAQLGKLPRMVQSLREHAGAIRQGLRDLPGIRFRRQPDPAGDIGYGVYFQLADRARRDRCINLLREHQVPASTVTGSVLLPVQESVIAKRARAAQWPSFATPEGKAMQYGAACCPRTLDVHDRFVQIRVGAKYTSRIDDYIVAQVRELWPAIIA